MTIEFSTDKDRLDVSLIHSFLANESYWVPGIARANVEKCIKHSLCFGVYMDGRQIGFARAVTDFVRLHICWISSFYRSSAAGASVSY